LTVYFDPSVLIALYIAEPAGALVRTFLEKEDMPVFLNQLQEFEI